ncbi:MAG: hypothetical protein ACOYKN_03200, partial [Pirellula sp.]
NFRKANPGPNTIGFQPVRLEQQKDVKHEHLRTNVMKTVTGWKPIPRDQNACSTLGWVSVQSRACLSNHMSDLTKALWLISEKSTTLFSYGEYTVNT